MSATQHTTNLHLSQFQATDIPTWMSDYNGDMMKIDNSIGNISDLVNPEWSLVENINAFQDDVDALETLIGSATDLPVPTDTVAKNILQINNNLSGLSATLNALSTLKPFIGTSQEIKTKAFVDASKLYSFIDKTNNVSGISIPMGYGGVARGCFQIYFSFALTSASSAIKIRTCADSNYNGEWYV